MPCRLLNFTIFVLFIATTGPAAAAGDAAQGAQRAAQWCAACHQIAPAGPTNEIAPAFPAIAADASRRSDWLRAWLSTSHPNMPNLNLSRAEIDDLIAYIASLAPR